MPLHKKPDMIDELALKAIGSLLGLLRRRSCVTSCVKGPISSQLCGHIRDTRYVRRKPSSGGSSVTDMITTQGSVSLCYPLWEKLVDQYETLEQTTS